MSDIVVVGGAGGTRARTEDLAQGSEILAGARDRMEGVAAWATIALSDLGGGSWGGGAASVVSAHVADALDWVNAGPGGARAVALEIEEISRGLAETVTLLEDAERGAGSLWDRLGAAFEDSLRRGVAGLELASWLGTAATKPWSLLVPGGPSSVSGIPPPEPTALVDADLLEQALGVGHAIPLGPALLGPSVADFLTWVLALTAMGWAELLGGPHGLSVEQVDTRMVTPPSGTEDLVERIGALYPSAGDDGNVAHVAIECIEHRDGSRAWIVEIPGTQSFMPDGGANPLDLTADLQMMAGETSDVMIAVSVAMEQAQIPPGEAVMLSGHSLGGIAAMALASNDSFASRFAVSSVVTAGSPVARFAPLGGASVLSLENSTDIVRALDGAPNPDRATWITVEHDLRASDVAADRAAATSLVGSHEPATYARTAGLFDSSSSSSAGAWRDQNATFFADGASTSTRTTYAVSRVANAG